MKLRKPTPGQVKAEIKKLRQFIDASDGSQLEVRIAQIIEDALRWATEETTWKAPSKEIQGWAAIVEQDCERV